MILETLESRQHVLLRHDHARYAHLGFTARFMKRMSTLPDLSRELLVCLRRRTRAKAADRGRAEFAPPGTGLVAVDPSLLNHSLSSTLGGTSVADEFSCSKNSDMILLGESLWQSPPLDLQSLMLEGKMSLTCARGISRGCSGSKLD